MPLKNDAEKSWTGWLVDDLGGREQEYRDLLFATLEARRIPKAAIKAGSTNMWWRRDSLYIDVTSSMDGQITTTIHVQEYGSSLFVGRAAESRRQWNYYKRMAALAFLETIDRCITDSFAGLVEATAVHRLEDRDNPDRA